MAVGESRWKLPGLSHETHLESVCGCVHSQLCILPFAGCVACPVPQFPSYAEEGEQSCLLCGFFSDAFKAGQNLAQVSAERTPRQREWRPQIYRKCTDTPWLLLFFLFWTGLAFITGYSVVAGAPGGLLFGRDSFGNVCGKRNPPVEGAPLSGQDMTLKRHVFSMNSCHREVEAGRPGPTTLCVSVCPDEQLDTLEEVQLFANKSGSFLCVYSLSSVNYTQDPKADALCPRLPVPPSKPFPLLNRCVPQTPECYSRFASVLLNDADALHRVLSGVMSGRDTVFGLCVLALALSLAVMLTFRFVTGLLLHTLIALVTLGSAFVCGVLWWLYHDYTGDLGVALDTERDNVACLLGFAVVSTALTHSRHLSKADLSSSLVPERSEPLSAPSGRQAVLLVLTLVLRKRTALAVELLRVANKALDRCPSLLLQPLWAAAGLLSFWALWVAVLLSLGTAGAAQVAAGGQVEYAPLPGMRCMWGYHLVGLVWTSELVLACQHMAVAGAVVACYFNRNESDPPDRPVLSSLATLLCYHPGTAAKGSLLIPLARVPRAVVLCLSGALQDQPQPQQRSAWSRGVFRCCSGCLRRLDRCLRPLSQHAYAATAINGTDFCTSAQDACRLLSQKSRHLTSANCLGDIIIFLGKVPLAGCGEEGLEHQQHGCPAPPHSSRRKVLRAVPPWGHFPRDRHPPARSRFHSTALPILGHGRAALATHPHSSRPSCSGTRLQGPE
ncbi:choline transporter-like protein 3 isoform 2-T2 [Glossophaga mutica]